MAKLTKTEVDNLNPSDKDFFAWSDDPKGFGVKVFTSGVKSFVFQYRTKEGKTRRYTIGKQSGTLTVEQARKRAKELFLEVMNGGDPMGHKQQRREAMTVCQLLDAYLASPSFATKAKSTQVVDKGRIERHIKPLIGKAFADQLTADVVRKMQKDIADGKTAGNIKTGLRGLAKVKGGAGTADKAVLALRAAYGWAISEGMLPDNPAALVKVSQSKQRDVILDGADDYSALFSTLQKMENESRIRKPVADCFRFIAMTGARRGEATGLRWRHVDTKNSRVTLPPEEHKTGHSTGKPRIIDLPAEALAIVQRQPKGKADDYVFQSTKPGTPLSVTKPWQQVREEANLPAGIGLHGLRHSVGSHLAMAGASNAEIMQTLGHKQITTSQRYIHFAERARSTLAERAASVALAGLASAAEKDNQ